LALIKRKQHRASERAADNWAAREQTRIILGDSQRRRRATICLFIYSSRTDKGERTRDPIAQMSRPCVLPNYERRRAQWAPFCFVFVSRLYEMNAAGQIELNERQSPSGERDREFFWLILGPTLTHANAFPLLRERMKNR
jgi:hypothetical protein